MLHSIAKPRTVIPAAPTNPQPADGPAPAGGGPPARFSAHGAGRPRRYRIALYSHDAMGLGHLRRNLLIAQGIAESDLGATSLLVTGAREAGTFAMPAGVDCLTLPALGKDSGGAYHSRHLDLAANTLIALRARTIRTALEAFEPDVLIVDKVPRGMLDELDPTLEMLRARGRTRCVLGLRDILDDPATVRREWSAARTEDVIRMHFDQIWVYGDPTLYDPVREYGFSADVAAKVRYTGYPDSRARLTFPQLEATDPLSALGLPPGRLALCLVGGGQDGTALAEAFAQAALPPNMNAIIVTGPFMPREVQERLRRAALGRPRLGVLTFVTEPTRLLRRADRVIAMGGYNTVCEILSLEKPALIVPRVRPRREQLIRAERLRSVGLVDLLHPDRLSPAALSAWLASDAEPPRARGRIDLDGTGRILEFLTKLLAAPPRPASHQCCPWELQHVVG